MRARQCARGPRLKSLGLKKQPKVRLLFGPVPAKPGGFWDCVRKGLDALRSRPESRTLGQVSDALTPLDWHVRALFNNSHTTRSPSPSPKRLG